jgi:hypothetical protein
MHDISESESLKTFGILEKKRAMFTDVCLVNNRLFVCSPPLSVCLSVPLSVRGRMQWRSMLA